MSFSRKSLTCFKALAQWEREKKKHLSHQSCSIPSFLPEVNLSSSRRPLWKYQADKRPGFSWSVIVWLWKGRVVRAVFSSEREAVIRVGGCAGCEDCLCNLVYPSGHAHITTHSHTYMQRDTTTFITIKSSCYIFCVPLAVWYWAWLQSTCTIFPIKQWDILKGEVCNFRASIM